MINIFITITDRIVFICRHLPKSMPYVMYILIGKILFQQLTG